MHSLSSSPKIKNVKPKRLIGRGIGSKKGGHTATRGQKGQKSRSGYTRPRPGFEGGQMPLSRRIPKLRGFKRADSKLLNGRPVTLSVAQLVKHATNAGKFSSAKAKSYFEAFGTKPVKVVNSEAKMADKLLAKELVEVLKAVSKDTVTFSASIKALLS